MATATKTESAESTAPKGKPIGEIGLDAQTLIAKLSGIEVDHVVTYDELSQAIRRDVRSSGLGALQTARRYLVRENRIVFKTVRGEGLLRLASVGIVAEAASDTRKIGRATGRALKKLACANESELTPQQRTELIARQCGLGAIHAVSKPTAAKKLETAVEKSGQRLPLAGVLEAIGS